MAFSLQFGKSDTLASQMAAAATSGTLSSGNFTNFTGDYLVLDYDNPSKREVILCNVTGTAIASATRGQSGTSDVTHSAGAAVGYNFVPGHYSRAAVRTLGYAEITTSFTTTTTPTNVDVTGLAATVTVPTGGARIKITAYSYGITTSGSAGVVMDWAIYESATRLNVSGLHLPVTSYRVGANCVATTVASAGSHTYKVVIAQSGAGTYTVGADSTAPAYILVENIE